MNTTKIRSNLGTRKSMALTRCDVLELLEVYDIFMKTANIVVEDPPNVSLMSRCFSFMKRKH